MNESRINNLPDFIKSAIEHEIKIATEFELGEAQKRIEKRKSEIVAGVILHIQKMIDIERMGEKLIISIKIQ